MFYWVKRCFDNKEPVLVCSIEETILVMASSCNRKDKPQACTCENLSVGVQSKYMYSSTKVCSTQILPSSSIVSFAAPFLMSNLFQFSVMHLHELSVTTTCWCTFSSMSTRFHVCTLDAFCSNVPFAIVIMIFFRETFKNVWLLFIDLYFLKCFYYFFTPMCIYPLSLFHQFLHHGFWANFDAPVQPMCMSWSHDPKGPLQN